MTEQVTFNIVMTADGVNAVLNALGKTTTDSGLFPLFEDIRRQAMEQQKRLQEAAKVQAEA